MATFLFGRKEKPICGAQERGLILYLFKGGMGRKGKGELKVKGLGDLFPREFGVREGFRA